MVDITVLSVGNPIMGDDGVGPKLLELLCAALDLEPPVSPVVNPTLDGVCASTLVAQARQWCAPFAPAIHVAHAAGDLLVEDGAAAGMELVTLVESTRKLLLLDAIAPTSQSVRGDVSTAEAGQARLLCGDQIPRLLSSKMSPHQVSLLDVLTACRLLGREPEQIAVVGVVSQNLELAVGLSPVVQKGMGAALEMACQVLAGWLSGR